MIYRPYSDSAYMVLLKNDQIIRILYMGNRLYSTAVNGLNIGDSVETMLIKLGPPDQFDEYDDGQRRRYEYKSYNSIYSAEMGSITSVGIYSDDVN